MKTGLFHRGWVGVALLWAGASALHAQTSIWINTGGGNFTNPANWSAGVPGAADTALFTNNATYAVSWTTDATNANAAVATTSASAVLTQQIGAATWWITNRYVIGPSGFTGIVSHASGTLAVTNETSTALFVVGDDGGKGTLRLNGGTILADRLLATNSATSALTFNSGELHTLAGGAWVDVGAGRLYLGSAAGQSVTWEMRDGGTNRLTFTGTPTYAMEIGDVAGAFGRVAIHGAGTVFTNTGNVAVGESGRGELIVTNGAQGWANNLVLGAAASSSNNAVLIRGTNSRWTASGVVRLGNSGGSNSLVIADGGVLTSVSGLIGSGGASTNNRVVVTGPGSSWSVTTDAALGGNADSATDGGFDNQLIVTNGGQVLITGKLKVSNYFASSNNFVHVTGADSLLRVGGALSVGTNANSKGMDGRILVENGGTLEANTLVGGLNGSGTISNRGGVYQFTVATPTIAPNTAGAISISNGVIAFRGVSDANVKGNWSGTTLTNVTFLGNNTFRLHSSSNATSGQDYIFDAVAGAPTNYAGLELTGGNTLWRSANLQIGGGGTLLASNTVGTIAALVTNAGMIRVTTSTMTVASNLVISGSYRSDASTNTFHGNVTIAPGGVLAGGTADRFDFKSNFFISSAVNPSAEFDLASSAVSFSGGVNHTNHVTGKDLGNDGALGYPDGFTAVNFSYGTLRLDSSSDHLYVGSGDGAASNALYVLCLDMPGLTDADKLAVATNNLHTLASTIHIYYGASSWAPENAFLNDLTYTLPGGGLLMPAIPEPSVLTLLAASGLWFLRMRRK